MTLWRLAEREIAGSEDQPLHPLTARERFNNFGDIRQRDPAIKEMIGLDENADSAGALIQAARCASACLELGQPARRELFF